MYNLSCPGSQKEILVHTLKRGSKILYFGVSTLGLRAWRIGSQVGHDRLSLWPTFCESRHVDYFARKLAGDKTGNTLDKDSPVEGLDIYFSGSIIERKKPIDWRMRSIGAGLLPAWPIGSDR